MFQKGNMFGKSNIGRKRIDLSNRNRQGLSIETKEKISKTKKGKDFVYRLNNPCPYCKSTHVVSAGLSWRCFDCKRTWVKNRKGYNPERKYRPEFSCPKCGSHYIKSAGKSWHCNDCGKEWVKQLKQKEDYNLVRKLGVSKEEIEDMYWKQNKTQYQIAEILNVSQPAVNLFMKQHNIPNRGRIEGVKRRTEECNREAYEKVSKALKGNTNWRFSHKFPNKEETKCIHFFDKWKLPFKYVGNGTFKIDGKCPDFINEEKKQIIEFFGELWHRDTDEPKRVEFFKEHGWNCLIIWGKEVGREVQKSKVYLWEHKLYDKILKWMAGLPYEI